MPHPNKPILCQGPQSNRDRIQAGVDGGVFSGPNGQPEEVIRTKEPTDVHWNATRFILALADRETAEPGYDSAKQGENVRSGIASTSSASCWFG
jgi:hypothetical protein